MRRVLPAWGLLGLGCAAGPLPAAPDDLRVAGCDEWMFGACQIDGPAEVVVWHGASESGWTLSTGDAAVPLVWDADLQVARATVTVAPGDRLSLWRDGRPAWSAPVEARPVVPGLAEAMARDGAARADALASLAGASTGAERARVLGALARTPGGDPRARADAAVAAWEGVDGAIGRSADVALAAFRRTEAGVDLAGARAALEEAGPLSPAAEVHHHRAWATGVLESRVGRFGAALDALRELERGAARAGSGELVRLARSERAHVSQLAGRHADALRLHRALVDLPEEDPRTCARARYRNNLGWALVVAAERGFDAAAVVDAPDPAHWFRLALEALRPDCVDRASLEADIRLDLALAAERQGPAAARAALAEALPALDAPTVEIRLAWRALEARLALAEGRAAEALAGFEEVEREAAAADRVHEVWSALAGQARALEAAGREDEALARYARADALAAAHAAFVPITHGRDAFLAERDRAARDRVSLLLRRGDAAGALEVVRHTRAAFVVSLHQARRLEELGPGARRRWDEAVEAYGRLRVERERLAREAWMLAPEARADVERAAEALSERTRRLLDDALPAPVAAGALRPPGPGEVVLAWFEDREGLVGFAGTSTGVRAVRLPKVSLDAPADALGAALLGPLAPSLEGAARVTLLPSGALRAVDLHLLPLPGGALVERMPVRWSLDLGSDGAPGPTTSPLVVADPRGDLPSARAEGEAVAAALARRSVTVVRQDEATREALMAHLPAADLLHFAGHGVFGDGPWEADLLTAREGRLSVSDVLALPRVPGRVVLSGCETARTRDTAVETLGLAQAFVTTGSRAVVASARRIDDGLARAFAAALYRHGFADGDPAEAFRGAVVEVRAAMPAADVGALRLLTP